MNRAISYKRSLNWDQKTNMLTPEQITQFRTAAGMSPTPPAPGTPNPNDVISKRKAALGMTSATPAPAEPTADAYSENIAPMKNDITDAVSGIYGDGSTSGNSNVSNAADRLAKPGLEDKAMGVEDATLGTASDAVKAVFAPIAAPIQALIQHATAGRDPNAVVPGEEGMHTPEADAARKSISDWMQQHPDIAKTLSDAFTVGTASLGSGALDTSVSDAATAAKNAVTDTASTIKSAVTKTPAAVADKATQSTIAAIDPELTGAKASKAYQQVVTGNRTVTPSGLFTEQSLSPAERTIQIGTRLSKPVTLSDGSSVDGITLGKDAVKNQVVMKQALTDTESKLTTLLKGDPEINFNADKPTLYESLGKARDNAPNEFRIGNNQEVTKDVFNFANKVVHEADDSIEGVRDARTAFDSQAKIQYPTAFNPDGTVNVKTAAGNAIKNARDVINEHLYNTAPAGSDIQKLIAREADIFQANPAVSAKAAAGAGKSTPVKVVERLKKHHLVTTAAAIGTADEILKHTIAPGLPGF